MFRNIECNQILLLSKIMCWTSALLMPYEHEQPIINAKHFYEHKVLKSVFSRSVKF